MSGPACRFCAAPLSEVVADLGRQPLANALRRPDQAGGMEPFYPLRALVCGACRLVQLEQFHAPEEIFSDYVYFSSYSSEWLRHVEAYALTAITRFGLGEDSRVVEVASNDGYLLDVFRRHDVPVLGIDPAANVAEAAIAKGIPTLVRFFGRAAAEEIRADHGAADLLVANNVLAHVPDLNDFVAGLAELLAPEGVLTIEVPHLLALIEERQFDTIYHEHFSYFSLLSAARVLSRHGLELFDVDRLATHGGSLRLYTGHRGVHPPHSDRLAAVADAERSAGLDTAAPYRAFGEAVRHVKWDLLEFLISAKRENKSVAGYGAPAKGSTLLNYCGIGRDFLDYTVDRSPHKQGLTMPGCAIPIHPPERIAETRPDYVLILPWNWRDEIMVQMAHIRDWGGRFVVAVPRLRVLP